jgi:hypothetical protein
MEIAAMRTIELCEPVDIEALLVWTYRHQCADRVIGRGIGMFVQESAMDEVYEPHGTSADGVLAVARIGMLGTRVDGGGASAAALHIDAEIVHEAVMCLPRDARELVILHARNASRPDDDAMPMPRPYPLRAGVGRYPDRAVVRYADWDKHHDYGWCLVQWTSAPSSADVIRQNYATWRNALRVLAFALARDARLTRHRPIQTAAPIAAEISLAA